MTNDINKFFNGYNRKYNNIFKDYLNIIYFYKPSIEKIINNYHNANVITLFYTISKYDKYEKMLSYYEGVITSLDNTYNINKDEEIKYKDKIIKIGKMLTYIYIDDSIINLCKENNYIKSFFNRYKEYEKVVFIYYKSINEKIKNLDENNKYHNKTFGTTIRYLSLLDKNIKSCFINDTDNTFNSIFHIRKIQNLINENPYQCWYIGSGYNYKPYHLVNRDNRNNTNTKINVKGNNEKLGLYVSGGIFYSLYNFILKYKSTVIKYIGSKNNILYNNEKIIYNRYTTIYGIFKLMLLNTLCGFSQSFGVDEYFINRYIRFIQDCIVIKDENNINISNDNYLHLNQDFYIIKRGDLMRNSYIQNFKYVFNKSYKYDINFNIDYNYELFNIPYNRDKKKLYYIPEQFYRCKLYYFLNCIYNHSKFSEFLNLITSNSSHIDFTKDIIYDTNEINHNYIKLDNYINIFYVNLYNIENAFSETIYNGYQILLYRHFYNNESDIYKCQSYMFNDIITLLFLIFTYKNEFIMLIEKHIFYEKYFDKLKSILKTINLNIYDIYHFIKHSVLKLIYNKNVNVDLFLDIICNFYPLFCDPSEKYLKDIGKIDFFHTYKHIYFNNQLFTCDFDLSNNDFLLIIITKDNKYKFGISYNKYLKYPKIKELFDAKLSKKNIISLSMYQL